MSKKTVGDILAEYDSGPPALGTVILCEGDPWELEVDVPRPTGSAWIKRYPVLFRFVTDLGRGLFPEQFDGIQDGNGQVDIDTNPEKVDLDWNTILDVMESSFGKKEFINDYVPAVFGMNTDDKVAMKYLDRFLGPKDIIAPFLAAASMIIQYGSDREDVQEAQKKSLPEAEEEVAEEA